MKNILDQMEDRFPFESGVEDAEKNLPFCPEYFWVRSEDKAGYAQGFLSIKPDNQAALAFIGNDEPYAELRKIGLAVDEAQYTPRPGYDF